MDWVSLPSDVNDLVNTLTVYNGSMVASGHFTIAGSNQINKIASWNGSAWDSIGKGVYGGFNPYIYKTLVHNNELYAIGNFDSAGTVATKDIAKWNGVGWSGFGSGSNKGIFSIAVYNNEIFVGGTFDTIGGIPANRIAKWNGSSWQSLGSGVKGSNVNDMCVFQNELYIIGVFDTVGNVACNNVARWNGSNWNNVSTGLDYGSSALIIKNGKLLAGSQGTLISSTFYQNIKQWDGISWTLFSQQQMIPVRTFIKYNNELFCAGGTGTGPAGGSNVMKWDSTALSWAIVGTGVNNYIQGLCVYNNELYCGGYFKKSTGAYHNYIARYGNVADINEIKIVSEFEVYPNPVSNTLYLSTKTREFEKTEIELINTLGEIVLILPYSNKVNVLELQSGCYFLRLVTPDKRIFYSKFIKE